VSQPTYEEIRPLVARERLEGARVVVSFRCPVTGTSVASVAEMASSSDHAGRRYAEVAARSAQWSMRQELARSMSAMIGGGLLGSAVHQGVMRGTSAAAGVAGRDKVFDEGDREQAVLRAFLAVADAFVRDSDGRWVHRSALNRSPASAKVVPAASSPPAPPPTRAPTPASPPADGFTDLISGSDLGNAGDRRVMVRMLAEVALADGSIADEEQLMLKALGASPADLDRTLPRLTEQELASTSPGAREAMLIMVTAMAYSDNRIDRTEQDRLTAYTAAFGISRTRAGQLDRMAREHLVELLVQRAWREGPPDAAAEREVMSQAARLGVTAVQVRRMVEALGG
jgi:hypothetical protein